MYKKQLENSPTQPCNFRGIKSTIVPETLGVAASSGPELGGDVDLDEVDGELKVSLAVGQ